jgi:hypothetical protein
MRKKLLKILLRSKKSNLKKKRREQFRANVKNNRKINPSSYSTLKNEFKAYKFSIKKARKQIEKDIFSTLSFSEGIDNVSISGQFGLEQQHEIEKYLEISESLINFDKYMLRIDLENIERLWPSGITLLCSLKKWVELSHKYQGFSPRIDSTTPQKDDVECYLQHCGFYDYVGRISKPKIFDFPSDEIVPIRRETKKNNFCKREDEIYDLLVKHSALTEEQLEWFYNVIITEVMANVTEHGILHIDYGYWILAQYHKKHELISICIADNGIGIKNMLLSGPQKDNIMNNSNIDYNDEGALIKLAIEENVSGAINAAFRDKKFLGMKSK